MEIEGDLRGSRLKGSCRNDCPGVTEVQVGIGAVGGLYSLSLAGSKI